MVNKKKSKKERKLERELAWIIGFVAFLVLLFIFSGFIFESFNSFEYEGLTFTKERLGDIPVFHYYYYFTNEVNQLIKYNLYLRVDPRENKVVAEGEDISLDKTRVVFVSADPESELNSCPYGVLAVGRLARFLSDNGFVVEGGNLNLWNSKENDVEWITCETRSNNPVIEIKEGEETKILSNGNCYEISISSCDDVLAAIEMFELKSIIDAKERASTN